MTPRTRDNTQEPTTQPHNSKARSFRRSKAEVHAERPTFLQRLTGLRNGFCKEDTPEENSHSSHKEDSPLETETSLQSKERMCPQSKKESANFSVEKSEVTSEALKEDNTLLLPAQMSSDKEIPQPIEISQPPNESVASTIAEEQGIPSNSSSDDNLPLRESLARDVSSSSAARPPLIAARQTSLQRPPLAVSQSTATALRHSSAAPAMPPPIRSRLDSTCTESSRHRPRAHESFCFSVDSLQMIVDENEPAAPAFSRVVSSGVGSSKNAVPMTFVDFDTCKLERDCSALCMEPYSFDYSDSDDDVRKDGDVTDDEATIPSTQLRESSPTSVVKLEEEVPSWMLAWTGEKVETNNDSTNVSKLSLEPEVRSEPVLVKTERPCSPPPPPPPPSSVPPALIPSYLVPGAESAKENIVFSAWMAGSATDILLKRTQVCYDDVVQIVVAKNGSLMAKQYDGNILFKIDLRDKQITSHLISNSLGRAIVIREAFKWTGDDESATQSPPLCTLLPVSLPRELFFDDEMKLVDEARFAKYRYAMVAPFQDLSSADDEEATNSDDSDTSQRDINITIPDEPALLEEPDESWDPALLKWYAPDEQQNAVMYLQFLLDACSR